MTSSAQTPIPKNPLIGDIFPDDTMDNCQDILAVMAVVALAEDKPDRAKGGLWSLANMVLGALAYEAKAKRSWATGRPRGVGG